VLGKNVEIGASTTIDRGTLASTIIGDGSKIDNQCQIGHNVSIGKNVIISGCTGVAGSTTIQDNVIIGGKAAISDHLFIASGVIIQGASSVVRNIEKPGIYSSVNTVLPAKS
jgi:UDP-3-O-[3-hydroxymyristoyl] glucosamine N-acyltransferase